MVIDKIMCTPLHICIPLCKHPRYKWQNFVLIFKWNIKSYADFLWAQHAIFEEDYVTSPKNYICIGVKGSYMYIHVQLYLLLTELEVRTVSYGPSFSSSIYGPSLKLTGHKS